MLLVVRVGDQSCIGPAAMKVGLVGVVPRVTSLTYCRFFRVKSHVVTGYDILI